MQINIGSAVLSFDERGYITSILLDGGENLLAAASPFAQICRGGKLCAPLSLARTSEGFKLLYDGNVALTFACEQKCGYAVFALSEVEGEVDAVVFGSYYTTLRDCIGDIIGVVQGGGRALGIQALNIKTLAGFPEEYAECAIKPDGCISETSVAGFSYFESAAYSADVEGKQCSLLQLYCENRARARVKQVMSFKDVSCEPYHGEDSGVIGAAFALFCCDAADALMRIGEIEVGEGLPHPMLNGEWMKTSRMAMQSYLIAEFDSGNFDSLLNRTKQAGLKYLYHPEPFSTWGHFVLRSEHFPQGDDSLAQYCEKAAAEGVRIGLHTLSAFTTTNDSYVTPVPDKRLAVLGKSTLNKAIEGDDTCIEVADGGIFTAVTTLQTVKVGDELIQYEKVDGNKLHGCKRGAFGTTAAAHSTAADVSLLCDHPYRVFFPNLEMQDEYSARLGELFAKTGAAQISFDGLEGCAAACEDAYSINRFCMKWWEKLGSTDVINDASRLNHNLWHMHTRMNWGEPWGAKMREGMIEYRVKNQDFFRRNLFPRMLGWFLIRKADRKYEATPPEDIEWALSMSAGFDAGLTFFTSHTVLETNGFTDELLSLIKHWEKLRLGNAFGEELREQLRSPKTEWHLAQVSDAEYRLHALDVSQTYVCDLMELQPGQPGGADWVYNNPYHKQHYDLRACVTGYGEIENPTFITKNAMLKFDCTIKGGQYLIFRGGSAYIADRNFNKIRDVQYSGEGIVEAGQQAFSFSCGFAGDEPPEVAVKVFAYGEGIPITVE